MERCFSRRRGARRPKCRRAHVPIRDIVNGPVCSWRVDIFPRRKALPLKLRNSLASRTSPPIPRHRGMQPHLTSALWILRRSFNALRRGATSITVESQRDRERFENLHAWISIVALDTKNYDRNFAKFVGSKKYTRLKIKITRKILLYSGISLDYLINFAFFPYLYYQKENLNRHSFIEQESCPSRIWANQHESTDPWPIFELGRWRGMLVDPQSSPAVFVKDAEDVPSTIQPASTFGIDRFIRGNPRDSSHPSVALHSSQFASLRVNPRFMWNEVAGFKYFMTTTMCWKRLVLQISKLYG